jgi:hypothetical protein
MCFLMSEPKSVSCTRLSEVSGISHDSVNRFLQRESYEARDLFNESSRYLTKEGGTLSVDDCVLDKPYAQYMELVDYFWSGKHHRIVKGINLVTLYYTDAQGHHLPVNYRVVNKAEGKTKNEYFQEMLQEVLAWGLKPSMVTGDSWYACKQNLKAVKNHGMGFVFAIESNRTVSIQKGTWVQVQTLAVPTQGQMVWLREFGQVKLFRTTLKDQRRHYIVYLPDDQAYPHFGSTNFQTLHDQHWQIEQYHRMLKQVCNIERFQVRTQGAIKNHIFAALCSFVQLQQMRLHLFIQNAYQWQRELYSNVIAEFIRAFSPTLEHLNSQFNKSVNA